MAQGSKQKATQVGDAVISLPFMRHDVHTTSTALRDLASVEKQAQNKHIVGIRTVETNAKSLECLDQLQAAIKERNKIPDQQIVDNSTINKTVSDTKLTPNATDSINVYYPSFKNCFLKISCNLRAYLLNISSAGSPFISKFNSRNMDGRPDQQIVDNSTVNKRVSDTKLTPNASDSIKNLITKLVSHTKNQEVLNNLLIIATTQADVGTTKLLAKNKGVNINFLDQNRCSALHYAAIQGDIDKVKALIESGANVNIKNEYGNTPLHAAVILNKTGVDKTEVIKFLLQKMANINAQDQFGNTALHFSVEQKDPKMAELLLEHHADPNIRDSDGKPPLYSSRFIPNKEMVQLFVAKGANLNLLDQYYTSGLLFDAMIAEDQDHVKFLLLNQDYFDLEILTKGVIWGRNKMLPTILLNMFRCTHNCHFFNTILSDIKSNVEVADKISEINREIQLLSHILLTFTEGGYYRDFYTKGDMYVLSYLYEVLNTKFNRLCNNNDASKKACLLLDDHSVCAKQKQEENKDDSFKVLKYSYHVFLERFIAFTELQQRYQEMPLMWELYNQKYESSESNTFITQCVVDDQWKKWADLYDAAIHGDIEKVKELIKNGTDINVTNQYGYTLLHAAVMLNRIEVAKLLLDQGANVNARNIHGDAVLYFAASNENREIVELLLEYGADPNGIDGHGGRSMFGVFGISPKAIEIVQLLLKHKANPNMTSELSVKLMSYAVMSQNKEYVEDLIKHGSFIDLEIEGGPHSQMIYCQRRSSNLLEYALMNDQKDMAVIILENMSDKNIAPVEQNTIRTPLLDPILTKMIKWIPPIYVIEEKIKEASYRLKVFSNTPNLENKKCLCGATTLPLLEQLYGNLYVRATNNTDVLDYSLLSKAQREKTASQTQEAMRDAIVDKKCLEDFKSNTKAFLCNFITQELVYDMMSDQCPFIGALYSASSAGTKSARKDVVPPEQSPEFLQQHGVKVPELKIISSENRDNDALHLSGDQDPKQENDNSD